MKPKFKLALAFNLLFTLVIYIYLLIQFVYPMLSVTNLIAYTLILGSVAFTFGVAFFDFISYCYDKLKENEQTMKKYVELESFGKDHLSLLLYVESRCVDNNRVLDMDNLRVNTTTHPLIGGNPYRRREKWTENNGTLLNTGERLADHDDIDCLDDLDNAGLIEIISLVNGFMSMTDKGNELVSKIRSFKTEGGQLRDFKL